MMYADARVRGWIIRSPVRLAYGDRRSALKFTVVMVNEVKP